ncbi:NADH-quinone oxidoreductase subunit J [Pararhodospirillum photometricum]|uniref:NADH-quinone oxidoreductase subunit J n=1 Tax=Pararhodospirillum photometricum DSM 122 TaxID=1150469 RepID=H6SNJ8_PARPM|nr:NADH-quinone oxidoreductase subunit J [Pararhodospirillum photometricum]CCG09329.1 NADH-ubiquinone/plastoquinone oxidoreductase,chain 6 [Pararhodospirillum photometricum DSM 122]
MIAQTLIFYMLASILVGAAFMVVVSRNPVHSVLWLILAFVNAAGLFILAGAEFLAMVLVVVYVGAVAVLFLFVVMMLNLNLLGRREGFQKAMPLGIAVAVVIFTEIVVMVGGWQSAPEAAAQRQAPTPDLASVTNTEALAQYLYTHYFFLFQTAGLILLVAMVGAILLTHRRHPGVRRQSIAQQIARRKEDTLSLHKVPTGKGIS